MSSREFVLDSCTYLHGQVQGDNIACNADSCKEEDKIKRDMRGALRLVHWVLQEGGEAALLVHEHGGEDRVLCHIEGAP